MPTGYTHEIYEGKDVSAKDFILTCARAFGACVSLRDEPLNSPLPTEFIPSTFYKDRLQKDIDELNRIQGISYDDLQKEIDLNYDKEVIEKAEYINKIKKLKKRYEDILLEIKCWEPPTEEHDNLKKFAISQIEDSIKFDCNFLSEEDLKTYKYSVEEWRNKKIETLTDNICRSANQYKLEVENTNKKNAWIRELINSLK